MEPSINHYFEQVEDPRKWRNVQHKLIDILILSIIAVLCGAEGWEEIERFGKSKISFLKQFLELPKGIPSHDTIRRVFMYMNPSSFGKAFMEWTAAIRKKTKGEIIPVDGKTLRGSKDLFHEKAPIHMVSAWAEANEMVLGQLKVDAKSNEITAIPKLLELLNIEECIVTIDAMGCQKEIAKKIIHEKADYILALKGNQSALQEEVETAFSWRKADDVAQQVEKGHGRIETRKCSVINRIDWLEEKQDWKEIKSLVRIEATREYPNMEKPAETEIRCYISSLHTNAEQFNTAIRKHWTIENNLHWSLDITFREDDSRKRAGFTAENFSTVRKIALNMLKKDTTIKQGLSGKRLAAGWDEEYLKKILQI